MKMRKAGLPILFFLSACSTSAPPTSKTIPGSIDRNAVETALQTHKAEFTQCFENEAKKSPTPIQGEMRAYFLINAEGRATQASIEQSDLKNKTIENCVLTVIGHVQFPQPEGGIPVAIKYPFRFHKK